ncbi:unnamed protein product [Didymodactylos carnosus]|uniref:EF-hand domain-containing protein n=1 Tax=Didymodactylos carnosus TaxID=1234261 RepID=A0A814BDR4_9BILA|nr:unnamed protein product [Didymodactylos carnosus]CAF3705303.1 unnamed protein product [Didymodactylos carnosus]
MLTKADGKLTKDNFTLMFLDDEFGSIWSTHQWADKDKKLKIKMIDHFWKAFDTDSSEIVDFDELITTLAKLSSKALSEEFGQFYGYIMLEKNNRTAVHCGKSNTDATVYGKKLYSNGIHRIRIKIEKLNGNAWVSGISWIFLGIISSKTQKKEDSYLVTSANGWGGRCGMLYTSVYVNGIYSPSYGGFDGDIAEKDTIELILNCNENKIQLFNERSKNTFEIAVDINRCPFPWQLQVNFVPRGQSHDSSSLSTLLKMFTSDNVRMSGNISL